ncbi:methionine--tRNA ligase [Candidatus Kaiserbacteria bacterium CG10_big_fil_rev_8_21_14_0_10_45_20]|uniref:Methionine--tRNA ligase n=1 Tax=Candidatus Kaiserbacteria bacterium CG10_big_fil_rev_8_21_14_0_10_45_20 TaxID=1974607 RepID=A0A2H0UH62_9BACT|nr:MAG: methionine--tRNA ligase [Candidatus Kaiserbacteria bacterium CG10_big_fil_rev_8_21_14_0_10_45_20]
MRKYITTTLPYVNAKPHIGNVFEFVQADALARLERSIGNEVFFNTGTDEHGQKIYQKALAEGRTPQEYVDEYAQTFDDLKVLLNLSYDAFIRTTDPKHIHAAQEFWKLCEKAGDIYKKNYSIKYCVGCELEKTDSELEEGKCPIHPSNEIEVIEEENYFFRFSKYADALLSLYKNEDFVVPRSRVNEIISLINDKGLQDFSISRVKEKMPWGIPVPGDDSQVMYVWFDALINYISTIGWPTDMDTFHTWWPVIQFAGKDQVRQQVAMWQAMLLSAGLPPSKQIFIHGFINVEGQKISKSVGNTIHPADIVDVYGTDALRYYYLRHIHPFEDSDFTMEHFKEAYNAHLANGIGNVTARIMKLAEDNLDAPVDLSESTLFSPEFVALVESYEFNRAMDSIWGRIQALDERIQTEEPFKVIKTDEVKGKKIIEGLVKELYSIGCLLQPFMPETSDKIKATVRANKKPETLFPRLEV